MTTLKLGRAAKLLVDEQGYAIGKLISLELVPTFNEAGEENGSQLEWIFSVQTSKGTDADKHLWTGLNINPKPTYFPEDGSAPQLNKLTQILLNLKLTSIEELNSTTDIELNIDALIGKEFKFKLKPQKNKPALSDIDISTICFADSKQVSKKGLTVGKG